MPKYKQNKMRQQKPGNRSTQFRIMKCRQRTFALQSSNKTAPETRQGQKKQLAEEIGQKPKASPGPISSFFNCRAREDARKIVFKRQKPAHPPIEYNENPNKRNKIGQQKPSVPQPNSAVPKCNRTKTPQASDRKSVKKPTSPEADLGPNMQEIG